MVMGPDSARHRGHGRSHVLQSSKVTVPDQSGLGPVDAHIDDHGPRLDHVAGHELGNAHGGKDNIGAAHLFGNVPGPGMADRDRRILCRSMSARGLPTMLLRPMTTAFLPDTSMP